MTDYKYKYGHGYKEFSLPEEHVLGELKMKQMMPLENLKAAVLDACIILSPAHRLMSWCSPE